MTPVDIIITLLLLLGAPVSGFVFYRAWITDSAAPEQMRKIWAVLSAATAALACLVLAVGLMPALPANAQALPGARVAPTLSSYKLNKLKIYTRDLGDIYEQLVAGHQGLVEGNGSMPFDMTDPSIPLSRHDRPELDDAELNRYLEAAEKNLRLAMQENDTLLAVAQGRAQEPEDVTRERLRSYARHNSEAKANVIRLYWALGYTTADLNLDRYQDLLGYFSPRDDAQPHRLILISPGPNTPALPPKA